MKKSILILVSSILLMSGCATWKGVKQDSNEAWDTTKTTSKKAWKATKEGVSDAYDSTKEAIHEATADEKPVEGN